MAGRKIKLNSQILSGNSLAISASRLSLTAAYTSTPNWGGADGGTISIQVGPRSELMVAPDSVRFTVDLSAATFDTAAVWTHPGGDFNGLGTQGATAHPAYDTRLHDLLYFWDFDDARTWDKPVNVLSHWRKSGTGYGPAVGHCYNSAGTYTVGVTVIEPSSGKVATATTSIHVGDPDTAYPGAQTICVYPDGEGAGTVPDGAQTVAASDLEANIPTQSDSLPLRWLFKRGGTYDMPIFRLWPGRPDRVGPPDVYFGTYGTGAKPICSRTTGKQFQFSQWGLDGRPYDFRVTGIDFTGNFDLDAGDWGDDASSGYPVPAGVADSWWSFGNDECEVFAVIHDCIIRQFWGGILNAQDVETGLNYIHFDDCDLSNFRGQYVILTASRFNLESSWLFTGNKYVGHQNLPAEQDLSESPLRLANWGYTYFAGNDIFTPATTNALLKIENSPEGAYILREHKDLDKGPWIYGSVFNIHSNTFEGQATLMTINRTAKNGASAQNGIIDGNIWIGGPNTQEMIEGGGQGITIRNNLMWVPPRPKLTGGNSFTHFFQFDRFTYTDGTTDNAYNFMVDLDGDGIQEYEWQSKPWPGMAPIRIYSNTLVCERDLTQQDNVPDLMVSGSTGGSWDHLEAVFEANNVFHLPNMGETVSGLSVADILPFKPHYVGPAYWDNGTKTHTPPAPNNEYDISGLSIPTFAPTEGSPVLGSALTGDTAYLDIEGEWRPAYPSMGAWEMAST